MKFYKVVFVENDRLYSWLAQDDNRVEYIPGEWVSSKYPLFVFGDSFSAFSHKFSYDEVWEVEVENVRELEYITDMPSKYDEFWEVVLNGGSLSKKGLHAYPTLEDTYIADRVKLIKRVSYEVL